MEKSNQIDTLNTLDVRLKYACENIFNNTINLSYENMVNLICEKIFNPELSNNHITARDIEHKIAKFEHAYDNLKHKFKYKTRDNGEDSFEHQKEVVYLYLLGTEQPSFEMVMVLLEHDHIEDTNITVSGMRENHDNDNIVFPVALMTKKAFSFYIHDNIDQINFQLLRKYGILNSKTTLNDEFNYKKKYNEHTLSTNQRFAYERYEELRKKYKTVRNKDYCEKMLSEQSVLENAININHSEAFYLSDEKISELSLKAIEGKGWDRLHGILTLKNCSLDKINRKIEETEKYFKNILTEFFPNLWELIEYYLQKIKTYIIEHNTEKIKFNIDNIVTHGEQHEFVF